jgi:hypothetical protein
MGQQMDPTALCDFGITRRVSFGIILSPYQTWWITGIIMFFGSDDEFIE